MLPESPEKVSAQEKDVSFYQPGVPVAVTVSVVVVV